ncbi:RND transporter [Celeribacter arenosi]|uniref:RND transporter n=1 Tax=Celeribacter arenosi TaxID=792649 RepID=A0ABP7KDH5_9RHOB
MTRLRDKLTDMGQGAGHNRLMKIIDRIPTLTFVFAALTLGLAPFVPEPHVWEKLNMLVSGTLIAPVDIFDLVFHGAPWVLLALKLTRPSPSDAS